MEEKSVQELTVNQDAKNQIGQNKVFKPRRSIIFIIITAILLLIVGSFAVSPLGRDFISNLLWQTYTTKLYNYSIQYPIFWETDGVGYDSADKTMTGIQELGFQERFFKPKGAKDPEISLQVYAQKALDLQTIINTTKARPWSQKRTENTFISGVSAVRITGVAGGSKKAALVFTNGYYNYVLYTSANAEKTKIFDEVVSRFKLLEVISIPESQSITGNYSKDVESYTKRRFKTTGVFATFYADQKYPSKLTAIGSENLLNIKCSLAYNNNNNNFSALDPNLGEKNELSNSLILNALSRITKVISKSSITSLYWCNVENGKTILVIHVRSDTDKGDYIYNLDSTQTLIAFIPEEATNDYSCKNPLELTTDGLLYIDCGGWWINSIYEVDLNKKNFSSVANCKTEFSGENNSEHSLTCKYDNP